MTTPVLSSYEDLEHSFLIVKELGCHEDVWRDVHFVIRVGPHELASFPSVKQLVLCVDGHLAYTVESLQFLRGRVFIDTEDAAVSAMNIAVDGVFAETRIDEWLGFAIFDNGRLLNRQGALPESVYRRLDWSRVDNVRFDANKATYTRTVYVLAFSDLDAWKVLLVRQSVTQDGAYAADTLDVIEVGIIKQLPRYYRL